MTTDSSNPYQSPSVCAEETQINSGEGRASAVTLKRIGLSLVVCEIGFVVTWIFFLASVALAKQPGPTGDVLLYAFAASYIVTWIAFATMLFSCRGFGALPEALAFVIPVIGILVFFEGKKYGMRFMQWNGYRPCFVGVVVDKKEVEAMNADEHYRPSSWFDKDGVKRQKYWCLSDCFLALLVATGLLLAAIVMASIA